MHGKIFRCNFALTIKKNGLVCFYIWNYNRRFFVNVNNINHIKRKEKQMEKISLFKGWMEDNISPCDFSNNKKFHNYLAAVSLDDYGNETRSYSDVSDESDLYFNVSNLNVGDIVVANCFNKYKKRTSKTYYIIVAKDAEYITFSDEYSTYRKAYKAQQAQELVA